MVFLGIQEIDIWNIENVQGVSQNIPSDKEVCKSLGIQTRSVGLLGCEEHVPPLAVLSSDPERSLAGQPAARRSALKYETWLNAVFLLAGFGIGYVLVSAFSTVGKTRNNWFLRESRKEDEALLPVLASKSCFCKSGPEGRSSCFA